MYDGDFFDPDCECCEDAFCEYDPDPADCEDFYDPDPYDVYDCEQDLYDEYDCEPDPYDVEENAYYSSPARAALEEEGFIPQGAYIEHEALLNSYMRETGADAALLAALMHDLEKD